MKKTKVAGIKKTQIVGIVENNLITGVKYGLIETTTDVLGSEIATSEDKFIKPKTGPVKPTRTQIKQPAYKWANKISAAKKRILDEQKTKQK